MAADGQALRRLGGPSPGSVLDRVERRTGLTPTGLSVLGLAALAWVAAYALGSRVVFLMVYGSVVLLAALTLLGRRPPAIAAARSDIPVRVREGQVVSVELSLEGKGRLGTLVLEEQLGRVGPPVRLLVPSLAQGARVGHAYSFTARVRGVYPIGPLVAIWSDPFGLTRKRSTLLGPAELIVHPTTDLVHDRVLSREWEDPPIRPPVSKPWPTGFEFYGMRDYVAGDDPRRIVWRATARTGRILVREAEQGITDRVTILFDDDARTHAPGWPSETFEAAIRAVASVGAAHIRDGFVVSVDASSGRVAHGLRGPHARVDLLDALARAEPGRSPLTAAIRRVIADPRRDSHHVLVAPHLDHAAAAMLRLMLDRGGSMSFVHVVTEDSDPESIARAGTLGCELIELRPGVPLASVFRRSTGAGLRR